MFGPRTEWGLVYRIDTNGAAVRSLLTFLFWAWGLLGFAFMIIEVITSFGRKEGVGIGTSGFIIAEAMLWVGGMVFFGLAALLASSRSEVLREIEPEPRR